MGQMLPRLTIMAPSANISDKKRGLDKPCFNIRWQVFELVYFRHNGP